MRLRRLFLALILTLSFASVGLPAAAVKGSGHSTKSNSGPKRI